MPKTIKEKVYTIIAETGIWTLSKIFPEYFATEPLRPTDRYIEYPWVINNLPPLPATVLDIGCSGSMFPLFLQALKYQTYGIDIREYCPYYTKFFFTRSDICIAPYKDNQFDCITAVSSIEHIGLEGRYGVTKSLDGDFKALNEIYRILKPNGLFLMTVPIGHDLVITKTHRIYNNDRLNKLLQSFNFTFEIESSPEANYSIALIKATKNG